MLIDSLIKGIVLERKDDVYFDSDDCGLSGIVPTNVQKKVQKMA